MTLGYKGTIRLMNKKDQQMEIGRRICEYRNKASMTQMDLAVLVGSSPVHICRIEGGTRDIMFSTAIKLAKALSIQIDDLVPEQLSR